MNNTKTLISSSLLILTLFSGCGGGDSVSTTIALDTPSNITDIPSKVTDDNTSVDDAIIDNVTDNNTSVNNTIIDNVTDTTPKVYDTDVVTIAGRLPLSYLGEDIKRGYSDIGNINAIMQIMAFNAKGKQTRAEIHNDGSFTLKVPGNENYAVAFVDENLDTTAIIGYGQQDSIPLQLTDNGAYIDLGELSVAVDATDTTAAKISPAEDPIELFSLTEEENNLINKTDDTLLLNTTVDVDNDGISDLDQENVDYFMTTDLKHTNLKKFNIENLVSEFNDVSDYKVQRAGIAFTLIRKDFPNLFNNYDVPSSSLTKPSNFPYNMDESKTEVVGVSTHNALTIRKLIDIPIDFTNFTIVAGDYSLTLTDKWNIDNSQIDAAYLGDWQKIYTFRLPKDVTFPTEENTLRSSYKFNVDTNNKVTSIDYKFMAYNTISGDWEEASDVQMKIANKRSFDLALIALLDNNWVITRYANISSSYLKSYGTCTLLDGNTIYLSDIVKIITSSTDVNDFVNSDTWEKYKTLYIGNLIYQPAVYADGTINGYYAYDYNGNTLYYGHFNAAGDFVRDNSVTIN